MSRALLVSVVLMAICFQIQQVRLKNVYTQVRQSAKIIHMIREVVLDMQRKFESLSVIREKWQNHRRFQLADIAFEIRKRYAILRKLLIRNLDYDEDKREYSLKMREEGVKKEFLSVKDMARCQQLQLEIDKLVNMVEELMWKSLNSTNKHTQYRFILRTKIEDESNKTDLRERMGKIGKIQEEEKKVHPEDGFDSDN